MLDGQYRGFEIETHPPGIAVITFNEPERMNGFSRGMKRDFEETMVQAQGDPDTRVIVITGSGRAFCAGDDVFSPKEGGRNVPTLVPPWTETRRVEVEQYGKLRVYQQSLLRAIRNLDKLTIAAINGVAIQTGLSLALACDYRIAANTARLGSATLRFGFLPDEGGHWLLLQHLGLGRTIDFLMRKQIVDANEALALGLVTEVVEPDDLMTRAMALAVELANGPQVAMRLLKRSIYNALDQTFEQAGDDIAAKTAISDHHPDTVEGMTAYRERRPPHFNRWLEEPFVPGEAAWFAERESTESPASDQ